MRHVLLMSGKALREVVGTQADEHTHALVSTLRGGEPIVTSLNELTHIAVLTGYAAGLHTGIALGAAYPDRVVSLRRYFDEDVHEGDADIVRDVNGDILKLIEAFDEPGT